MFLIITDKKKRRKKKNTLYIQLQPKHNVVTLLETNSAKGVTEKSSLYKALKVE